VSLWICFESAARSRAGSIYGLFGQPPSCHNRGQYWTPIAGRLEALEHPAFLPRREDLRLLSLRHPGLENCCRYTEIALFYYQYFRISSELLPETRRNPALARKLVFSYQYAGMCVAGALARAHVDPVKDRPCERRRAPGPNLRPGQACIRRACADGRSKRGNIGWLIRSLGSRPRPGLRAGPLFYPSVFAPSEVHPRPAQLERNVTLRFALSATQVNRSACATFGGLG